MSEVLLVSKAVEPPWNDSSKNLVRDLASAMQRHRAVVLTSPGGVAQKLGQARIEGIYSPSGAHFAPGIGSQLPVLRRLLLDRSADIFHFFFAPNPRTSAVARFCSGVRRRRSVQTVCSAPAADADLKRIIFADRTIVLSQHTLGRFLAAGLPSDRLSLVPPCIPPLARPSEAAREATRLDHGLPLSGPVLLYPGDLEFSRGADRCISLLAALGPKHDAVLAICARAKTKAAATRKSELQARVAREGLGARVKFLGELPDIHAVLAAADVVLLPSETLYAKMDLPLVLLEAMSLTRPVVVLDGTAAAELCVADAARAVSGSTEALLAEVERLLADAQLRRQLGERARQRVVDAYSPAAMALAYETLYDELG